MSHASVIPGGGSVALDSTRTSVIPGVGSVHETILNLLLIPDDISQTQLLDQAAITVRGPTVTATMRDTALRALKTSFEGVVANQPAADPYPFAWNLVTRTRLRTRPRGKPRCLSIMEQTEVAQLEGAFISKQLRVRVEFIVGVPRSRNPSEVMNEALLAVQRRIREDITLSDTVLNTVEISNEIEIPSQDSRKVRGAVFLELVYRHARDDPRIYVSGDAI